MRNSYAISLAVLLCPTALYAGEEPTEAEASLPQDTIVQAGVTVVDTIDTEDRYTKIVLYSDQTWKYCDLGHPHFDEEDFEDHWDNNKIHAYKGIDTNEIPDEVLLTLVDSLHSYCPPVKGLVRSGYKFRKVRPHKGADIPLHVGDPVRAAFDGKVRVVMKTRQTGGYGNLVVIRHANGLETYYGHLNSQAVKENDIVKAGDIVGYGGSTGRSTGPHLHFETRYMGQPFDPERLIDFVTGELRQEKFIVKKHYFSIYSHYGQTDKESLQAAQRKTHVIRKGDTLGSLARHYGTTVANICKLNGFSTKKTLKVGQRVIVR